MNKNQRRGKVFLEAIASDGSIVEQREVAYDHYYDGSLPLIDNDLYRAGRGIGGVAVHNDGTVDEHRAGQ